MTEHHIKLQGPGTDYGLKGASTDSYPQKTEDSATTGLIDTDDVDSSETPAGEHNRDNLGADISGPRGKDASGHPVSFVQQVKGYAKMDAGKVFGNKKEVLQGEELLRGVDESEVRKMT